MGCGGGKASANKIHAPSKKDPLPAGLSAAPCGRFLSALPPREEGRRDFARIFFSDQRKIFLMAPGMPSIRALQPSTGPTSSHIGDLTDKVTALAERLFCESLTQQLAQAEGTAPDPGLVEALRTRAVGALSVNVGIDFALHMKLLPTFLQPIFVIVLLGNPIQARACTYGFVAEKPQHVVGDRPESKRTPFCVRLLSPNLLEDDSEKSWEVEYRVRELQISTILQAVEMEIPGIREATKSGRWEPML
eukprot:TRINITY_DN26587_c0_g3_i1.p1 TRINITY_DN26587_c0_g3~~TRINITY_DN26587_c0_g3_i1.p1  ORF type:complete len:248 (+),score=43.37 TRINITY_DN26587_c0_g3_i1:144-887(+)